MQMENLRQFLVAIAALTLIFSVVSGANPNYFTGYSAFADHDDDEDDNNGVSSGEDRDDVEDNEDIVASFGERSNVELELGDEVKDGDSNAGSIMAELEVEVESGDLKDGDYKIAFECENPTKEESFDKPLTVKNGEGDFAAEITLLQGTEYGGCKVSIGDGLSIALPLFTAAVGHEDDEEDERDDHDETGRDDDDDEDDEDNEGDDDEKEEGNQVQVESKGAKMRLKLTGLNVEDGTYDVLFTCDEPKTSMTIEDSLEVKGGEGKFKAEISLDRATYSGCELSLDGTILSSLDSIKVHKKSYHDDDVEEKRKEKIKEIVSTTDAREEHKKRIRANPASPGDYRPGWSYTLMAIGTSQPTLIEQESDTVAANSAPELVNGDAIVAIDMAVWKSNKALILFNILGGTVEVDGKIYTVEIGYALYSLNHDVMRLHAFVSDESGDILKIKLRGSAVDGEAEFPTKAGDSIDLLFEGGSSFGRSVFGVDSELTLEGTLTAVEDVTAA